MAHMLGLEIPGVEPSTSYYPGYEWWPRNHGGSSQQPPQQQLPPTGAYPSSTDFSTDLQATGQGLGPCERNDMDAHYGRGLQRK